MWRAHLLKVAMITLRLSWTVGLPLLTFWAQQPRQMLGEGWAFHFHTAELTIQEQPKMGKRWCPGLFSISPSSPTSCTQYLPPKRMVAASCRGEPEKMLLLALFFSCCAPAPWAMAVFLMRSVMWKAGLCGTQNDVKRSFSRISDTWVCYHCHHSRWNGVASESQPPHLHPLLLCQQTDAIHLVIFLENSDFLCVCVILLWFIPKKAEMDGDLHKYTLS